MAETAPASPDISLTFGTSQAASTSFASTGPQGTEPHAQTDPLPGEQTVAALREAYPERITQTKIIDNEWALQMDGTWYYWADGRLLPEETKDQAEEFVGVRFYNYDLGPFSVPEISEETAERLRAEDRSNSLDTRVRFNDFLDTLYQVNSRASADRLMIRTRVLGLIVTVHPMLEEPIRRVNRTVGELAKFDPEIQDFVQSLHQAHGYNWRNIANTLRRSYHSYGIAVDLVPLSYRRQQVYWLWAAESGIDEWWTLPRESRWTVPDAIIQAFEDAGFIWGGKWLSFDNIHFEYRPEVILMAEGTESLDREFVQD